MAKNLDRIFSLRNIIIFVILFGITLMIIDLTRIYYKCPPTQIVYRYVPRTFKEEQENPVPVSELFKSMFDNPSPWVGSFTLFDEPKKFDSGFILRDFEDGAPHRQDQDLDRHLDNVSGELKSDSFSFGRAEKSIEPELRLNTQNTAYPSSEL